MWSCSMMRQFAENAIIHHRGRAPPRSPSSSYEILLEATQGSSLRYETAHCPHDVLVLGRVKKCCHWEGSVQAIILGDYVGQLLTVLLVRGRGIGGMPTRAGRETNEVAVDEIFCMKNPSLLIEIHPDHNEEGARIYAVVAPEDVFRLTGDPLRAGQGAVPCAAPLAHGIKHNTGAAAAAHIGAGLVLSQFLYDNMEHPCVSNGHEIQPSMSAPPVVAGEEAGGGTIGATVSSILPLCISIRTALLHYTGPDMNGKTWSHMSVTGWIVRKDGLIAERSIGNKRKRSDPNQTVVLRDECSADTIVVYVPSSVARLCVPGFVVTMQDVVLRTTANGRRAYLVYVAGSRLGMLFVRNSLCVMLIPVCLLVPLLVCVGIIGMAPLNQLGSVTDPYLQYPIFKLERSLQSVLAMGHCSVPTDSISSIFKSGSRNKCLWRIFGQIVLFKQIDIYVRCRKCYSRAEHIQQGDTRVLCCRKHRAEGHRGSLGLFSGTCEIWWSAVIGVEDGSMEARVYIEGACLLDLLEGCFRAGEAIRRCSWSCGRDMLMFAAPPSSECENGENGSGDVKSFADFKRMTEDMVSLVGSVKFNHFESRHYSAAEDCLDRPSLDRTLQYLEVASVTTRADCFSSSCALSQTGANGNEQGHGGSRLVARFLRQCSICVWIEMYVKVLSPKYERSVVRSHYTKKIKVQRAGPPDYMVDFMEYVSESCEDLSLDCIFCRIMPSNEVAIHTWNIINSMGDK